MSYGPPGYMHDVELWGGPHDGLVVEIPRGAYEIRVRCHSTFDHMHDPMSLATPEPLHDIYTWVARHFPDGTVVQRYEWSSRELPRAQ